MVLPLIVALGSIKSPGLRAMLTLLLPDEDSPSWSQLTLSRGADSRHSSTYERCPRPCAGRDTILPPHEGTNCAVHAALVGAGVLPPTISMSIWSPALNV